MPSQSLAEMAHSGDRLRKTCGNGHHACRDQCYGASLAGYREVEKLCAFAGFVDRYRRSLDRHGCVDRVTVSGHVRAWIGKVKVTACACDGTEKESDLVGGNYILGLSDRNAKMNVIYVELYRSFPRFRQVQRPC